MNNAIEYVEYYMTFNKRPSEYSNEANEKYLGRWFGQYKAATKGQSSHLVYEDVTMYLKTQLGEDVLDNINRESKCMSRAVEYVNFIKENGRVPSRNGELTEKKIANWFSLYKSSVLNGKNSSGTLSYPTVNEYLLDNLGGNALSNSDSESIAMNKAVDYVQWTNRNNKKPSISSKLDDEKKLANWLSQYKMAYNGDTRRGKSFESVNNYLISNLSSDILMNVDLEQRAMHNAIAFVELWMNNGKKPSDKSKNEEEKKLGKWFSHYKSALNGNGRAKTYETVTNYLINNDCI